MIIIDRILNWLHANHRKIYINRIRKLLTKISIDGRVESLSIISQNCFAGRIMQDMNVEFKSPTVGLFIRYPDFITFCSNLRYFLAEAKLEFVDKSKDISANQWRIDNNLTYPIANLGGGGVEIHFLHYDNAQNAAKKWYRRAKRVNFDNLIIVGMDRDGCLPKDIDDFDFLNYKNKIMFVRTQSELSSAEYIPEFQGNEVGNPYTRADWFYKHLLKHFSQA